MNINDLINPSGAELATEFRTMRMGSEGAQSSASSTPPSWFGTELPFNQADHDRSVSPTSPQLTAPSSPRPTCRSAPRPSRRRPRRHIEHKDAAQKRLRKNQKERNNCDYVNNALGRLMDRMLADNAHLRNQVRPLTKVNIGPKADAEERHLETPLRYTKKFSVDTTFLMYTHQTLMTEYVHMQSQNDRPVDAAFFAYCMQTKGTSEFPEHNPRFHARAQL